MKSLLAATALLAAFATSSPAAPTREVPVGILIVVADGNDLHAVATRLAQHGAQVDSELDRVRVIVAHAPPSAFAELGRVDGVSSLELDLPIEAI